MVMKDLLRRENKTSFVLQLKLKMWIFFVLVLEGMYSLMLD